MYYIFLGYLHSKRETQQLLEVWVVIFFLTLFVSQANYYLIQGQVISIAGQFANLLSATNLC